MSCPPCSSQRTRRPRQFAILQHYGRCLQAYWRTRSQFSCSDPSLPPSCFQAEDDDVCDGALAEQGPIVAHDLRKISPFDRSSTLLCNSIFGLCQQPAVQQLNFPLSSVPENQKQWTSQGRQPFQVVHFSDVHIDREYTVSILAEVISLYN